MYNDYYLEQINNKLSTVNTNLNEIIENQETLIEYEKSGDYYNRQFKEQNERKEILTGVILIAIVMAIIYRFITKLLP